MKAYEEQIFEFITQNQHFEYYLNLVDQFGMVKRGLLTRFWKQVEKEIEEKIKREGRLKDWSVITENNIFARYSKLYLYNTKWGSKDDTPIRICWEDLATQPYFGIWVDNEQRDKYNFAKLKMRIDESLKQRALKTNELSWWLGWSYGPLNFNQNSNLTSIIPDVVEDQVRLYTNCLYDLAVEFEDGIDNFLETN